MGKALVLQNVNFSANKLDTVTIDDNVPCTGIALSQNTINFTSLTTATLTATLTPSNTTDSVVWSSSDTDVATVSNGVVTAVGIGSATITATCGTQSATCSVSVIVVLTETDFIKLLHRYMSGTNLSATPPKDYIGCYGEESGGYLKAFCCLSPTVTPSGYKAITGNNELYYDKYVHLIPRNAKSISVTSSTLSLGTVYYSWMDSTTQPTYSTSDKGCRALSDVLYNSAPSNNTITISIPTDIADLDSVVFGIKFTTDITNETDTGVTITFA